MTAAVFLDRDGTVSEEVGYVNHIDRFVPYPWSAAAIGRLNAAGLPVVLFTNQSGVARGYFPEELVRAVHDRLSSHLGERGARIDRMYYCPHHPEGREAAYRGACACRKPAPGMLRRAERELGVDLSASYVVGDRYLDLDTGFGVGARGVLVLTGYGKGEYAYRRDGWPRPPDHVAENLDRAVDWILSQPGARP